MNKSEKLISIISIIVGIMLIWISFVIHSSLNDQQESYAYKGKIIIDKQAIRKGEFVSFRFENYYFLAVKDRDNE
jgi:energy-converting hydrogenase Eha subunit B